MKLLIYTWENEYMLKDIIDIFNEWDYQLSFFSYPMVGKDKDNNNELLSKSINALSKDSYDAVFSINYFPDVARACYDANVIYISWTYDCPLNITKIEETLIFPTNRAFFFDKVQVSEYSSQGITTAFHLPLAFNSKRLSKIECSNEYRSNISFVGKVYHSTYPYISSFLDEYYKGYLDAIVVAQKNTYGAYIAKDSISDSFLSDLNSNFKSHNCPYTTGNNTISRDQLAVSIASEATFENRMLVMGLLSKKFDLRWYTTPDSEILSGITRCNPVNYYSQMPQVFKSSKINLHIGLHAIPSGISLRQLDILGSGGFLLSSYQPEMFEYFNPGEDFDYFICAEEAYEKANFYLNNDALRKKIALSGTEKAIGIFDYRIKLKEMFEVI